MLILIVALSILTIAANVYYVMCIVAAFRFFNESPEQQNAIHPPVTILIPARGADFEASENLASFCNLDYPEFQIICGVLDSRDPMIPLVEQMNSNSARSIELSIGGNIIGENLKVSNL